MTKEIDGSLLEGGGQILRSAIAFSSVLQEPVVVTRIRAKREQPGLRPQHLHGILALQKMTDAEVKGAHVGSSEITFRPQSRRGGKITVEIGTAGAISLILQALMVVTPFCDRPSVIQLSGGTNVSWSPPIDYLQYVLLPRLKQMNYIGEIHVRKRGYYPRGGGIVHASFKPANYLMPINLNRNDIIPRVSGISHCGSLPEHIVVRQAQAASRTLEKAGYQNITIRSEYNPHTASPGSGISLWASDDATRLVGSDALGKRGLRAEEVGEQAAQMLLKELETGAPVDKHAGDMLIPYIAVAKGESTFLVSELTQHTVTNIHVVEQFLDIKFIVDGKIGKPALIKVKGVALEGFSASPEYDPNA